MTVVTTVLFGHPQSEIRSAIVDKLAKSSSTRIVTGFATPGGLNAIAAPIKANPASIKTMVIGASTYPGFEALDQLNGAGVPLSNLYVHLGHTRPSGGRKNPTVRFHPMLHSKIYYMEFPGGNACAFIGSHNMTSFALNGANGEASVLLEGPANAEQFDSVRAHIDEAERQSVPYSPIMKESLAWWTKEYLEGIRAEIQLPDASEWRSIRTILIFAQAQPEDRPSPGNQLYFEIPDGIDQIESLKTEAHLYLFEKLPADPHAALNMAGAADASFTCQILGVDNKQGNIEVSANWEIQGSRPAVLKSVPSGSLRPRSSTGMQQVRAEISNPIVDDFEHQFENVRKQWDPEYIEDEAVVEEFPSNAKVTDRARISDDKNPGKQWKLVRGLTSRQGGSPTRDMIALEQAAPDSGSFVLVSLRRRSLGDNKRK